MDDVKPPGLMGRQVGWRLSLDECELVGGRRVGQESPAVR